MESILRQTLSSFELIVIDDGSTDRTGAIAERLASGDSRVRVLRRPHEGLSAALNAGIAAARGEYAARMDADDISAPDRLRKQVAYVDAHLHRPNRSPGLHLRRLRHRRLRRTSVRARRLMISS